MRLMSSKILSEVGVSLGSTALAYRNSCVCSRFVCGVAKVKGDRESSLAASLPVVAVVWERPYWNLKGVRCHCKAAFSCHCTFHRGHVNTYCMAPREREELKAERSGAQPLVSAAFCRERGKAFAGADSNSKTQDGNPQPSSSRLHTHPEASAAGSLQLLRRNHRAKIYFWRAHSTGWLGVGW